MKKLTDNKFFWMVVSLLLSFLFWFYLTSTVNDVITRTFSGVKVELAGENILKDSRKLAVTDLSTGTVSVSISGPRRIVSGLSSDKLSAIIDVSKMSQSSYSSMQYTISFPNDIDTTSLTVTRKFPDSISFMVSKLVEKEIPVRGSFDGSVMTGFTAEAPVFEPSSIVVSGPEYYISNISYAWVTFSKNNIDNTYSVETSYILCDENGHEVPTTNVTCSTDVVKATLPINEVKDVPLGVNLIYPAGVKEENVIVTIEPESVSLSGDSSVLNGLNIINLATIDLSTFESSFSEKYPIQIDNGLKNISGITEASVKIDIVNLSTKKFKATNLAYSNLTDGYTAEIISKSLEVKLRGTEENLSKISDSNIRAVANLTDYVESTGQLNVPVKIYVDGNNDVSAVGTYTITINIEKRN